SEPIAEKPSPRPQRPDQARIEASSGLQLVSASGGKLEASSARLGSGVTRPAMPQSAPGGVLRDGYDTGGFYDEAFERGADGLGVPRAHYAQRAAQIASMGGPEVRRATELANRSFLRRGVTFTVYSEGEQGAERILPFAPSPRIIP